MIQHLKNLIIREALASITPPIACKIHSNKQTYLREKGINKLGFRALRRLFSFHMSGQKKYLTTKANAIKHTNVLWLYLDIPQIGDAMMDLAPRSILHDLGLKVDLCTLPHIADLFQGDIWFNSVETNIKKLINNQYDLVIVSSFKWRSIKHKTFYAFRQPWLAIYEKFTGPEINRSLYSAVKISEIFGLKLNDAELAFHAKQKLVLGVKGCFINPLANSVAITLGGVDPTRSYTHWYDVVLALRAVGVKNIVLLGQSKLNLEDTIISATQDNDFKVHNFVGKTTLKQCFAIMQNVDIIIASDGGLMHLAVATNKPVIGLFNQAINPIWRMPSNLIQISVQSATRDVNDICTADIITAFKKATVWTPNSKLEHLNKCL